MAASSLTGWRANPTVSYVAPFAAVLIFIALRAYVTLPPGLEWPVQTLVPAVVFVTLWPRELNWHPKFWLTSCVLGVAVFLLWIAPDVLISGYRTSSLFTNSFLGAPHSSLPPEAQRSGWVLFWRAARATLVVPVAEELFWRGWLMRWLINNDFLSVRLGTYAPVAFFVTAILFASEHGPYWDVGLLTGVTYNLWMVRTKSVADCILMHAVTNGVLSWYVFATGNWQYWM